jgi:predicted nucleic acid-binding protein
MTKARIIVDSSVIVSALEPTDASHEVSRALVEHLINGPYQIRMPMHGLFEIACAFTRLRTVEKTELPPGFSLGWQKIPIEQVPIDLDFVKEYLVSRLKNNWNNFCDNIRWFFMFLPRLTLNLNYETYSIYLRDGTLDQDLPYLKAGDFIFLAMAKKMGLPLITNDQELYTRSQECGVSVFTPEEFLSHAGGA